MLPTTSCRSNQFGSQVDDGPWRANPGIGAMPSERVAGGTHMDQAYQTQALGPDDGLTLLASGFGIDELPSWAERDSCIVELAGLF
jgi:hypothetical protein